MKKGCTDKNIVLLIDLDELVLDVSCLSFCKMMPEAQIFISRQLKKFHFTHHPHQFPLDTVDRDQAL